MFNLLAIAKYWAGVLRGLPFVFPPSSVIYAINKAEIKSIDISDLGISR